MTRMDFGPNVRVMSTWAFATALDALGVIPSADDLFNQIEMAGRTPPGAFYDWIPDNTPDDLAASYNAAPDTSADDPEPPSSPAMGM